MTQHQTKRKTASDIVRRTRVRSIILHPALAGSHRTSVPAVVEFAVIVATETAFGRTGGQTRARADTYGFRHCWLLGNKRSRRESATAK